MTDEQARELGFALRRELDGEVRFDPGSRHLYATDASAYRQVPLGVVLPRHVRDVERAVALCRRYGAPITGRGGGTSLAGQATNTAVVFDFSKYMNRILEIDPARRVARVEPGVVLDDLRAAAAEHGLTFGPDPSTHNRCTLGGMIGNNSCGIHSVMAGRTSDNVRALDVLLYDGTRLTVGPTSDAALEELCRRDDRVGELYRGLRQLRDRYGDLVRDRFPAIPRRVSGFNLDELLVENGGNVARALVGTEGTCAVTLSATVELVDEPPARTLVVLGYPTIEQAGDHVPEVLAAGPIGLEGVDRHIATDIEGQGLSSDDLGVLPEGEGWLLVEFGGTSREEADAQADELCARLAQAPEPPRIRRYDDPGLQRKVWQVRESGVGAAALVPGHPAKWPGWEDAAVPPEHVGAYLRDFRRLLDEHGLEASIYGHFGDGCIHCRISFDYRSAGGVEAYRRFTDAAADLVVGHGGSLSGEHGDGQSRADLLETMFGPELVGAFRTFKRLWDPDGRMNPGKVVDPYPRTSNLRLGAGFEPWEPDTWFGFEDDGGRFSQAALRCVGVGTCRRDDGAGTMCPSFMVTHEEMHSTRGRARLLFEMLQPDADLDGWQDEHVHEALDLCLACKGCKTDCPVDVDMATYKAEFMAHYYEGHRRPVTAYALGFVHRAARLASKLPGIANTVLSTPGVATLAKRAVGVTTRRPAPAFAGTTLRRWYRRRGSHAPADAPTVMLFPDTFVDHFDPGIGRASIRVLEHAGYRVELPPAQVCCGRPLYDFGFLDAANRQLERLVEALGDHVEGGGQIVGLEPSCVAVFRDELTNLRPDDPDAQRLAAHTRTLAEFLVDVADYTPAELHRRAIVQRHCHQEADMGFDADAALYDRLGLDWEFVDGGCCGLAGSFGFEAGEKYDVSRAAGERKLIPTVRDADVSTIVMADGFSCRTQIDHLQDERRALHLAQVLALALDHGAEGPDTSTPPETAAEPVEAPRLTWRDGVALGAVGALAAGAWAWRRR